MLNLAEKQDFLSAQNLNHQINTGNCILPEKIVAIACSAGGPKALSVILGQLPKSFNQTIIIAQHMALNSAHTFTHWLNSKSKLPVEIIQENKTLERRKVYVCPSESDWEINSSNSALPISKESVHLYSPSCDVLLSSLACSYKKNVIGIILNGMGDDGVEGMITIRNNGGLTIAQEEKTSSVFGMNKIAIEEGAIDKVLTLDEIAAEIISI